MTERMHPYDLRAQLAMEFYKLYIVTDTDDPSHEAAIQEADRFLAQLARTAKPAPAATKPDPWDLDAQQMVPNPCAGLTFSATGMDPQDPLKDRVVAMRMRDLMTKQDAALVEAIRQDAAKKERERIIKLLTEGVNVPHDFPFNAQVLAWSTPKQRMWLAEPFLRAALEPKP